MVKKYVSPHRRSLDSKPPGFAKCADVEWLSKSGPTVGMPTALGTVAWIPRTLGNVKHPARTRTALDV